MAAATDIVFVDSLQVSANIGPDCWNRLRPQPVNLTVYLHLHDSYLTAAGNSDDVNDSINYGHLSKTITQLLENAIEPFDGVEGLACAVTERAFTLAGTAAAAVRVVVGVPKMILLAGGFSVDVTTSAKAEFKEAPRKVFIEDLTLSVIIGVNPPEREAKQRVITNVIFHECPGVHPPVDYSHIVKALSQNVEASSYLTLEKFALEIVKSACLSSSSVHAVTVRVQKPSALTFARSSGVEITRSRSFFITPS